MPSFDYRRSEQQPTDFTEIVRDVIGLAELGSGLTSGNPNHSQAGRFGSLNTGGAVFDRTALVRREAEFSSDSEINFGIRLVLPHSITTNRHLEILCQTGHVENHIDDLLIGTGRDSKTVPLGQCRYEFVELLINRPVLSNEPVEMLKFAGEEFRR